MASSRATALSQSSRKSPSAETTSWYASAPFAPGNTADDDTVEAISSSRWPRPRTSGIEALK